MKPWFAFASLFGLGLLAVLLPERAHAGCPQTEKCLAITQLEVALEDAPACVHVGDVEPENGCVCDGTFIISNDCTAELTSDSFAFAATAAGADSDPNVPAGKQTYVTVRGGSGEKFAGVVSVGPAGAHEATLELEEDGMPFKVNISATVAERGGYGGCSLRHGAPGAALPGFMLLALALVRRRARSA